MEVQVLLVAPLTIPLYPVNTQTIAMLAFFAGSEFVLDTQSHLKNGEALVK